MTPERHEQIKKVFLAACERAEEELEGFLADACGDDDALRRDVEALLAHHHPSVSSMTFEQTDSVVGGPDDETVAAVPAVAAPPDRTGMFEPGDMVSQRYRIVALLGAGGMGVVYRADDLHLNQTVALKFLSSEHASDAVWLERFRREVRLAREVTHPNVCRVHDIDEVDGIPFISMAYIDGEDLRTLLKRIGRLPSEKAIEIARQLCAGLAAAHLRGVLHRDLKPANVMIDGRGQVRITDFGLAGIVGQVPQAEMRAGTPRYMAPEQFAGKEVSERSDLYALGLVLYELFTGQPAFEATSVRDYYQLHQDSDPSGPSSIVSDIDADVDSIILACLRKDPKSRPTSALAVAAALPGGDLLEATVAAGETPTPEMVAASGREWVRQSLLWACLGGFIALAALGISLSDRTHPIAAAGLRESPEVLASKARSILREVMPAAQTGDFEYGFVRPDGFERAMGWNHRTSGSPLHLAMRDSTSLVFWYRWSDTSLVPLAADNVVFTDVLALLDDPPGNSPGHATLALHPDGRLLWFESNPTDRRGSHSGPPSELWEPLLEHAELESSSMQATTSSIIPRSYADERFAWVQSGSSSEHGPIRVEAASRDNQPILFAVLDEAGVIGRPAPSTLDIRQFVRSSAQWSTFAIAIVIGGVLAWRNHRAGRCDRRGAIRIGAFVFALRMLVWLLGAHHAADVVSELGLLAYAVLGGIAEAVVVWSFYLALEPYVRRFWPQAMVTWSRVLAGRFRDSLVGRDVLIGAAMGAFWVLVIRLDSLAPEALGLTSRGQLPGGASLSALLSARDGLATCFDAFRNGVYQGLLILMFVVLLRVLLRRPTWASLAAILVVSPVYVPTGSHAVLSWFTIGLGGVAVIVWGLTRFGLLAVVTALAVAGLLGRFPITFDFRQWYADVSLLAFLMVIGMVIWAFLSAQRAAVWRQPH